MSVLSATTQHQVETRLTADGVLTKSKISELKDKAEKENTQFLSLLVREGDVSSETLTKIIAQINKVPYVNLTEARIDPDVLALLPRDVAQTHMAVPLGEMHHRLVVAMLDADNVQAADFLSNKIGRPIKVYAASEEGIRQVLQQYEGAIDREFATNFNLEELEAQDDKNTSELQQNKQNRIETIVQDSPISKTISSIFEYAAKNRASDIHIEPLEKVLKIRCRIDGVL